VKKFVILSVFLLCFQTLFAENFIWVNGKISDPSGKALSDACIVVYGTTNGTFSDQLGCYRLQVPDNGKLFFSSVGFLDQTVAINGQSKIDITMQPEPESVRKEVVTSVWRVINKPNYQSTTYRNNYSTNIINGETGHFNKSSFTWTITQNGNIYNINTNAVSGSFNVTYSGYNSENKLYYYNAVDSANFDGSRVKMVMVNGKLSDYANGNLDNGNILSIISVDNSGYIYKLGK